LKEFNPFVKSIGIYVSGERRTGSGELPEHIVLSEKAIPDLVQISMQGFFTYDAYYLFSHTHHVLYGKFAEPDRIFVLGFLFLVSILGFICIYWVSTLLDVDRIQVQALKHAFSLSGRTLHGLKTHFIHANHLHRIVTGSAFPLNAEQKLIVRDFELSRVEMDGHMSIMRLDSFKGCRETIDLAANLHHLVQIYRRSNIVWDIQCNHSSLLPVDRDIFTATVGNLIKNAFDFSDKRVWVTTDEKNNSIQITISNTGKRIPKDKLNRILKLGHAEGSGTGLGLHICREWLGKLGGSLVLESNSGATVAEVSIPLSKGLGDDQEVVPTNLDQGFKEGVRPTHEEMLPGLRIAIIDDLESLRITLSTHLKALGVVCETFDSIKSFLDRIEKDVSAFQVVIVDRILRGENAVQDRFPDTCRYLGFTGTLILYSCDSSSFQNPNANHGFDWVIPKDEKVDWNKVLMRIKERIVE
jgi:hypothetical protein